MGCDPLPNLGIEWGAMANSFLLQCQPVGNDGEKSRKSFRNGDHRRGRGIPGNGYRPGGSRTFLDQDWEPMPLFAGDQQARILKEDEIAGPKNGFERRS